MLYCLVFAHAVHVDTEPRDVTFGRHARRGAAFGEVAGSGIGQVGEYTCQARGSALC